MILKEIEVSKHYILSATSELLEDKTSIQDTAEVLFKEEIQRAFQQGKVEGERQGYAKAIEEQRHLSMLLHTIADHLVEYKKRLLIEIKPEIIELSFQIAETIMRQELAHPKPFLTLLNSLIAQAMRTFTGMPLKVFLSPENLLQLEKQLEGINKENLQSLQWLSDPKLRPGDCRIECATGLLNADIARELNLLKSKLLCQNFSAQN